MHFLYFSVMCIGILDILSGHVVFRPTGLEVMVDFVFWPPKTFKVESHDQCLTESAQIFCGVFCHELEQI